MAEIDTDTGRLSDRKLSQLYPFTDGTKTKEEANPLTSDIIGILNFADHFNDSTLGHMIEKFLEYNHLDKRQDNKEKIKYQPEALEEFASMTVDELKLHPKYKYAFNIAKITSHASTAISFMTVSGAGRITMKKLDEEEKPRKGGVRLDPIDKMQLFDFALKGIACTAYQLVRCAPEHTPEEAYANVHGLDLWKHVAKDVAVDAKDAFLEIGRNPYNRHFWMGYFIFDGLLNIPAHFMASGKPISEMEEVAETFKDSVVEHGHGLLEDAKHIHLPFVHEKHRQGLETLIGVVNTDGDYTKTLSDLAAKGTEAAISVLDPENGNRIVQATREGGNAFGAEYGRRREHWDKMVQQAQQPGKRNAASIILGGLTEGAIAGIDAMGIYRSMARKDIVYDAISKAYAKYVKKYNEGLKRV